MNNNEVPWAFFLWTIVFLLIMVVLLLVSILFVIQPAGAEAAAPQAQPAQAMRPATPTARPPTPTATLIFEGPLPGPFSNRVQLPLVAKNHRGPSIPTMAGTVGNATAQ